MDAQWNADVSILLSTPAVLANCNRLLGYAMAGVGLSVAGGWMPPQAAIRNSVWSHVNFFSGRGLL